MSKEVEVKYAGEIKEGDTVVYFGPGGYILRGIVKAAFGNRVRIAGTLLTVSGFTAFLVIPNL